MAVAPSGSRSRVHLPRRRLRRSLSRAARPSRSRARPRSRPACSSRRTAGAGLRVGARRPLGHLRGAPRPQRRAALLRVHRHHASTPLVVNDRQNFSPKFSPDGREIAFVEDYNTLRVYNIATRQVRTLLDGAVRSSRGPEPPLRVEPRRPLDPVRLLGARHRAESRSACARRRSQQVINLTQSGFNDRGANLDPRWPAMLWRSSRDGLRGRPERRLAERRVRDVLHAGRVGPLPAQQGGVRAAAGGGEGPAAAGGLGAPRRNRSP
jgi:hypothetical protein